MSNSHAEKHANFTPLRIAIVTVSDTRTEETDKSGAYLVDAVTTAGHSLVEKRIVKDDTYKLRAVVATHVADDAVQVVLLTGGTGFTFRDNIVFCMPGSPGACKTAWEGIVAQQLDSRHKPCNFVDKLKKV